MQSTTQNFNYTYILFNISQQNVDKNTKFEKCFPVTLLTPSIILLIIVGFFILIATFFIETIRKWHSYNEFFPEESSNESKSSEQSQITFDSVNLVHDLEKNSIIIDHKQAIDNLNIKPSKSNLKIPSNTNFSEVPRQNPKLECNSDSSEGNFVFQDAECFGSDDDSQSLCELKVLDPLRKSCTSFKSVSFNEHKNTIRIINKKIQMPNKPIFKFE
jgi:hypothetical protein